jgi:hypothetical protein
MANESPSNPFPSDNELEKGAMAGDLASDHDRREEIEEMDEADRETRSEKDRTNLRIPLQQVRSHSSARSAKSHTDGYSYFEEEDQSPNDRGNENSPGTGKEFEVKFEGEDDPMNPKCKPTWRKWTIVLIGSFCSLCVTCASALYTSTYTQMTEEYHISKEVATVGLTTYVCGLGLGPMFLGPLSEFYGRRIIYLWAFGGFFVWVSVPGLLVSSGPCAGMQFVLYAG